jgi:putative redox protein
LRGFGGGIHSTKTPKDQNTLSPLKQYTKFKKQYYMPSKKVRFTNKLGYELSARLELPLSKGPYPFAIFAHAFTGNKSLVSVRHISRALTLSGIAVLRFDFTGLGQSEGDFEDTNFSSNVDDLIAAADFLTEKYEAPSLLIGHSLGGAAAIFASHQLDSIQAVATIGTPAEPEHVRHLLQDSVEEIEEHGYATVLIGERSFHIKKQFLEDIENNRMMPILKGMEKAILILHSPQDQVVEIENAAKIYHSATHPKSFVTLNGADHMLSSKDDAFYAGTVIASWVKRYVEIFETKKLSTHKDVVARLESPGFTTDIMAGIHGLLADEPEKVGGDDLGPSPYELLNASLGACTAMTLQMYARRKKWDLKEVKVHLAHQKDYKADCETCERSTARLDHFERVIELEGELDDSQRRRLLEIADRCPVHRTLASGDVRFTTGLL